MGSIRAQSLVIPEVTFRGLISKKAFISSRTKWFYRYCFKAVFKIMYCVAVIAHKREWESAAFCCAKAEWIIQCRNLKLLIPMRPSGSTWTANGCLGRLLCEMSRYALNGKGTSLIQHSHSIGESWHFTDTNGYRSRQHYSAVSSF